MLCNCCVKALISLKKSLSIMPFILLITPMAWASTDIAGKTILAKGEVKAKNHETSEIRKLRRRAKIFSVDQITTGINSKAQFSMSDGGLITLKENTEINISEYRFDEQSQQGSATLEVVSGGLRSISGFIKKSGGDYKVKTPVGSIGIRGTHFAVEVVDDNVVFGVFSGNIDVQLHNQQTLSLGASEDFAFASVSPAGQITLLTQAPPSISAGLVTTEQSDDEESNNANESSTNTAAGLDDNGSNSESDGDVVADASLYNESQWQGIDGSPIAELIAQRSGTLTYNNVLESNISSSQGDVSNFNMSMTIDFDNGSVPDGELSFTDQQGEWYAAYSGLINIDKIELGINFASHGNNRADGEISAAFANGLDELIGSFELIEIENKQVRARGSYRVKP